MKKYYKTEDAIINISDIRTLKKEVYGSGAKSNPYRYYIKFNYLDGDCYVFEAENKKEMDEIFENVFKALTEENS